MTCAACVMTIENHLRTINGVMSATVSLLTHKAQIQYEEKKVGLRDLIKEISDLGFEASYEAQQDKSDIRAIVNESVNKYRKKFLISLILQIPILILVWIIPYSNPSFVTAINGANGVPLYVFLIAAFSTII
jgi:Cu+-exporting ATPase